MNQKSIDFERVAETRKLAFESVNCNDGEMIAVEQLRKFGPLTADEIARKAGRTELYIRPRITTLKQKGVIRSTGERRPNLSGRPANVWELA